MLGFGNVGLCEWWAALPPRRGECLDERFERGAPWCPDDGVDRGADHSERPGEVVAARGAGHGEHDQWRLLGEGAAGKGARVAARFLAQPLMVFGCAVELEQEADRPLAGQLEAPVAVGGCLAAECGQAATLAPPGGQAAACPA